MDQERLPIIFGQIDGEPGEKNHEPRNIYISGIGGTGKSYLLRQIYEMLKERKEKVVLTSTTGVSAFNIKGQTIHSWSGLILPPQIPQDVDKFLKRICDKIALSVKFRARWRSIKYLLIDEISMLGANYIEVMDTVAKTIRKNNLPMGGIKIICSGDMLQLPPVNDDFCFKSPVWEELNFQYFVLTKAFRFSEQHWIDVLTRVRIGEMTEEDIKLFKECVDKYKKFSSRGTILGVNPTIVYPLRKDVESINMNSLRALKGEELIITSIDEYYFKSSPSIKYMCNEKQSTFLDQNTNAPRKIILREGAQVMLTVNLDVKGGLVNGSRGVISNFVSHSDNKFPSVKFFISDSGIISDDINVANYTFEVEEDEVIFTRSIVPLELAFATTTHKVQGSSLDYAQIDCGNSIFEAGQGYVALSRCRTIKGLFISSFNPKRVYPNPDAVKFEKQMNKNAIILQ